jgi:hypothetical protein
MNAKPPFNEGDVVRHRTDGEGRVAWVKPVGRAWRVHTEPTDGRSGSDFWVHCECGECPYKLELVTP